MIFIITGEQGEGKTTFLQQVTGILTRYGIAVSGIWAEGSWKNSLRDSFTVVNVTTAEKMLLCNREKEDGDYAFRKFYFKKNALLFGQKVLAATNFSQLVIIDEVGGLELKGNGWAVSITELLKTGKPMLWTVRKSLVNKIITTFFCGEYCTFPCGEFSPEQVAFKILSFFPEKIQAGKAFTGNF
jgi:nucleoside-triphosphatase